jgi:zinc transporter 1/2/3
MELNTGLKLAYFFVCLILTVLAGYAPFIFARVKSGIKWTGIANAFAGGIFLAVGLLHMLPESEEAIHAAFPDSHLPLAFLLAILGYALILLLEKVACNAHAHHSHE